MKKNLLLLAIVVSCFTMAQAQVGPGLFVGGSLGIGTSSSEVTLGSTTVDGPKGTTFTIMPAIGYYFTENVAAGIRIGYGSSKITFQNDDEESTSAFGVELFGRYASTIGGSSDFAWFLEANAGYGSITSESVSGNTTVEGDPVTELSFGIAPGLMYFPSPKFGFEASLGNLFSFVNSTTEDATDDNNKLVANDLTFLDLGTMGLNFGFHYYFNR
jgi:outer membrane protein